LRNISVLISSFLIKNFELTFSDPLFSFVISLLILYSTWPILKNSSKTLLHFLPEKIETKKKKIENDILKINQKISIQEFDLWVLNEDKIIIELKIILEKEKEKEEENKENSINLIREIRKTINETFKSNEIKEYFIQIN
jgi:Co/Zn/Cd efflux system component